MNERPLSPTTSSSVIAVAGPRRLPLPGRGWVALATALVLLGSTAAVFAGIAVARADAARSRRAFAASSAEIASTLQLAIQHEEDLIASTRGFVAGNPRATEAQFTQWASSVQALQRYPELAGFGYVVVVPASQLAAFATQSLASPAGVVSSDGTFAVVPPGHRPFYCFAKAGLIQPRAGVSVGTDFCAGEDGVRTLQARDSGQGSYTPIHLGGVDMLAVSTPVYRGGVTPATTKEREALFLGWVGMSLAPTALLERALNGHPSIAVSMHYKVGPSDVVFSSGHVPHGAQKVALDLRNGWTVTTSSAAVGGGLFVNGAALTLLIAGVMLSVLLGALMYVLGSGRGRALRLVARRTGELRHLALHDALTGLPNRALILDRTEQALARARRDNSAVGLMFLDIDKFKNVNDTFGHAVGDELLCAIALRLTGVLRDSDTVGRIGGDEFVVVLEGASLDGGAELAAERIRSVLAQPFHLGSSKQHVVSTHASIGIAAGVRSSADDLLRDADVALYEAKDAGRDRYVMFAPQMQTAVQERLLMEMDLRAAVGTDEFFLMYQPTFDLQRVSITGVEALLRWQHPTRGLVMPDTFIPVAEDTGLIVPLGRWVLEAACRQAVEWQRRGRSLAIAVNVSARQLDTGAAFLDTVRSVLVDTGLDAGLLTLEITESLLMRDADASARQLHALKKLGVRIAIDDFGTGYSSMAYLQRFPVDALKIDRSFISGIASSPESSALIRTLVQLGKTLGIETLAEGIEDHAQLQQLQREQCDSGQGYLFARPLSRADLEHFIDGQPGHAKANQERSPGGILAG